MGIGTGLAWLFTVLQGIANIIEIFRGSPTIAKPLQGLAEAARRRLPVGKPDKVPSKEEIDEIRAVADVMRSSILLGLLEYLFWATKVGALLFMFARWLEVAERSGSTSEKT